jgi:hypothetical protein
MDWFKSKEIEASCFGTMLGAQNFKNYKSQEKLKGKKA